MRVVLVLGSDDMTTRQIHERMPDVAQASLYRAVSRLVTAGIISVVERRRRGGAMERVYRVAMIPEEVAPGTTPEEFLATAEALARSLSIDAARHAASGEWSPGSAGLVRETVNLTRENFELLRRELIEVLAALALEKPEEGSTEFAVTVAAIPRRSADATKSSKSPKAPSAPEAPTA